MKQRYSRKTQKLLYWLIADYANFQDGKNTGGKASSYSLYKAKKDIKRAYLKHTGYKDSYKSVRELREDITELFVECMRNEPSKEEIPYLFADIVMELIANWIQNLMMSLDCTFSFALYLMSQKQANDLIDYLFEFMLSNDIPFRKEISELYSESEDRRRIYLCLKYKRCCISGDQIKFPHHVEHATKHGGYKHDKGDLYISPLCSKLHQLVHVIGEETMKKKYPMYDKIKLTNEEIELMKEIYPGYAEGYKKDLELND